MSDPLQLPVPDENLCDSSNLSPIGVVEDDSGFVRRSHRNPKDAFLMRKDINRLCEKIKSNHPDTVVFKIKEHILADLNTVAFDEILKCFSENDVCEAMYIQNLSAAIKDTQLMNLVKLLREKKIWCLNVGEIYDVTNKCWRDFCDALPSTNVTHLYVSEHVIPIALKNKMREHIRANRKKHDLHSSIRNIRVIARCTNMWWNPINAIKHQLEFKSTASKPQKATPKKKTAQAVTPEKPIQQQPRQRKSLSAGDRAMQKEAMAVNPNHPAYWAEGTNGKGGERAWKFNCICGEICSSYENHLYHPTGAMYECTSCSIWSHTECMMGSMSNDDLEEMEEVFCKKCLARMRREKIQQMRSMALTWKDGELANQDGTTLSSEPPDGADDSPFSDKLHDDQLVTSALGKRGEAEVSAASDTIETFLEGVKRHRIDLGEAQCSETTLAVESMDSCADVDRPSSPELARGEGSADGVEYGFDAFDKPAPFHMSPAPTSALVSDEIQSQQMDELMILPPAEEHSGNAITDNISTTTEADSESEVSREGQCDNISDPQPPAPNHPSHQNDGSIHPSLFTNDVLYLSTASTKQNPLSAPPPSVDSSPSSRQEFGNYPLLASLLGNPTNGNPTSGGAADNSHNFMAPGDMYYPLRDLTRLTPTMTSLPSPLSTVVGDTGVRKTVPSKAKTKTATQTQPKTAPASGPRNIPSSLLDKKGQRAPSSIPLATNKSAELFSSAAAAAGAMTIVKKKGNGKPAADTPKALVKKSPEMKTLAARPDHSALFAQSVQGQTTSSTSSTDEKQSISALAQGSVIPSLGAQDGKIESAVDRVSLQDGSSGSMTGGAVPIPAAPMTSQQAKIMLANAAAELARAAPGNGYKPAPQPIAKSVINLSTVPSSMPVLSSPSLTSGVGRPSLADLEKFKEVTKKESKKESKLKKDAAQQQAFAASILAASSALKLHKSTALTGNPKRTDSSRSSKSSSLSVAAPDGVMLSGPPKKKRTSKGAKFRMYTRVFLPSFKIEGSITQEKNGGWKYVQFDVGIPLPLPPSLAAHVPQSPRMNKGTLDGKWCRACDMEEICSANGSDSCNGLNSFGEQPYDNTEEDDSGSYGSDEGSLFDDSEGTYQHHDLPDGYDIKFDDDCGIHDVDDADSLAIRRKRDRADSMDASNNVFFSNTMSPSERDVVFALGMNTKLEDSMTGRGVGVAIGSAATMDDIGWHTIGLDDETDDWNL